MKKGEKNLWPKQGLYSYYHFSFQFFFPLYCMLISISLWEFERKIFFFKNGNPYPVPTLAYYYLPWIQKIIKSKKRLTWKGDPWHDTKEGDGIASSPDVVQSPLKGPPGEPSQCIHDNYYVGWAGWSPWN